MKIEMSNNSLAEASFSYLRNCAAGRLVPRPVRHALGFGYLMGLDVLDICRGRRRDLVPPRYLNFVGDGDYEQTGNEFLDYFVRLGGLHPSDSVLEVGCGVGRMARPLTRYLRDGNYEGLDIVPRAIRWCQKNVTARYPRFRFTLADIRNATYNPKGALTASEFRFPYTDACFDFAILTSVFTHLLSAETDHYLVELSRVLKPQGKCLATFFLLNDDSRQAIARRKSSLLFNHELDGCWTTNLKVPDAAVAFDEAGMATRLLNNGFVIESVHYGNWCERSDYVSYQDILVFRRI